MTLNLFKDKGEQESFISTYSNPFKSDKCEKILFTIEKSFWTNGETTFRAMVHFKSGDTTGYHNIESDDFSSLVKKTEEFIKGLK